MEDFIIYFSIILFGIVTFISISITVLSLADMKTQYTAKELKEQTNEI